MADCTPIETTNLGPAEQTTMDWSRPRALLAAPPPPDTPGGHLPSYLGTVRQDGRPHAAGVGVRWHDGDLYFLSWPGSRKSRNLATNPACTIAMHLEGIDLILEGEATRVTDRATLESLAALYRHVGW